jgi:hypothetical protein
VTAQPVVPVAPVAPVAPVGSGAAAAPPIPVAPPAPRAPPQVSLVLVKQVINGNGPCNKERLAVRRMAEEKGRWVRKAILRKEARYVTPLS